MAADASVPNNFTAGTPAVADDVDANFAAVVNWINTNAVHLDASKAFTSVPSGPASDPTSDNQLARKLYVDNLTRARGVVGKAQATASQSGISTVVDLTSLTTTFTAVASRTYKVSAMVRVDQVTAAGTITLTVTDGAGTQLAASQVLIQAGERSTLNILYYATPAAGSTTYKLRLTTNAGTVTAVAAATSPNVLIVEDIGAA